jgi:uncharacterized protein (DUF1800 family)
MPSNLGDRVTARLGRRGLLVGAITAGIGAMIAADVAGSAREPSSIVSMSDDVKLRHLLRRAGFGPSPADLDAYRPLGLASAVDRLVDFEQVGNGDLDARLQRLNLDLTKRADIQRWWMLRMIYTARPLEEKMTLFWHGLLTSAISKVGRPTPMVVQNNFLRANALGRFPDILKGISRDPAMMIWLDTASNKKGHANENYARELMELFALGIGNYTEHDVREGARAFTGWGLGGNPRVGELAFRFEPRQHDDDVKTFLGKTGNFGGDDIVDIIVQQPASARFITKKVFSFFTYPDPTDDVIQPFVDAYTSSNYSIRALVRAILHSDAFYTSRAYRAQVKSPVEYVVGTVRTLGVEAEAQGLPFAATQMGQELFNPPNVAGWPGGASWLSSGSWLARLNLANRVAGGVNASASADGAGNPHPYPFGSSTATYGGATPDDVVQYLANVFLDGRIEPAQKQVLVDYLTPPNGGNLAQADKTWLDERRRGAIYLTLAMPEFHLS